MRRGHVGPAHDPSQEVLGRHRGGELLLPAIRLMRRSRMPCSTAITALGSSARARSRTAAARLATRRTLAEPVLRTTGCSSTPHEFAGHHTDGRARSVPPRLTAPSRTSASTRPHPGRWPTRRVLAGGTHHRSASQGPQPADACVRYVSVLAYVEIAPRAHLLQLARGGQPRRPDPEDRYLNGSRPSA